MAETAGKRFNISEKSVKNEIYSCPPLETLPNKNTPVDCFCERRPKSLISRWGTRAKRALNVARIDKQNTGLIHVTNLADLRTDGVPKAQIRIANRLSRLSRKAFRRNSVSVEQIQDTSQRLIVLTSLNTTQANDL